MRKVTVQQGQCLMDIAMQELGGVEGLSALVEDNNLSDDINTQVYVGQILKIRDEAVNVKVIDRYRREDVKVANAISMAELADLPADFHWPNFHEVDFEAA